MQHDQERKDTFDYDKVLDKQREVVFAEREKILKRDNLRQHAKDLIEDVVADYVAGATVGNPKGWDLDKLKEAFRAIHPLSISMGDIEVSVGGRSSLTAQRLREEIMRDLFAAYDKRAEEINGSKGDWAMNEIERRVMLAVLDRKWREHLYEMDHLRDGIALRAYANKTPLVEYQREGFDLFTDMIAGYKEAAVTALFNAKVR